MKNIYILPTENFNPLGQQIWVRKNGGYFKPTNANPIANCLDGKVNIYITNDEEIIEGARSVNNLLITNNPIITPYLLNKANFN
jgi:hypothetical protein